MEAMQKILTAQFLGLIFLIMGLVGGLMVLVPSISPLFHAQFWPALIIIVCAVAFLMWKGAGKPIKMGMAIVAAVLGLWLVVNVAPTLFSEAAVILPPSAAVAEKAIMAAGAQMGAMHAHLLAGELAEYAAAMQGYLGAMAEFSGAHLTAGVALALGGVGGLIALVGGLFGIMSARS